MAVGLTFRVGTMAKMIGVTDVHMTRTIDKYIPHHWDQRGRYVTRSDFATFLKAHGIWDSIPAVCRYLWGLQ